MGDLNMDAAHRSLDLSCVPATFITTMLQSMSLSDRFSCALACNAWFQEAAAATRSIILRNRVQDLSCLQRWLEKHGGQVEVLQLHECRGGAVLTALPCPKLRNLLLRGRINSLGDSLSLDSRVWSDIAAATKLTSVMLDQVSTASQQADVVSALTALPDLEQLTWRSVRCGQQWVLSDSKLLQELTKLTALRLGSVTEAEGLEHLSLLTRLQDLSLFVTNEWRLAGCPGLQELIALKRLEVIGYSTDIPASVSQLTALQQLNVPKATHSALNKLSARTVLTCLCVQHLEGLLREPAALQLPCLHHLEVGNGLNGTMPVSFLATCTQLRVLKLSNLRLSPGSLGASSMLQHMEHQDCRVLAADGAADPVSWQQVFQGPGQLPHLTSLLGLLKGLDPVVRRASMECVVSCCSSLQVLYIYTLKDSFASALTCLSGLTSLILRKASDQQCSTLAQLTGLMELKVADASNVFAVGLRQLTALEQLTSLRMNHLGWSSDVLREHMSDRLPKFVQLPTYEYRIINKAPAGQPPDVSARLRRACELATAALRHALGSASDSSGGSL